MMSRLPALDTAFPALIFKASRDTIHHGAVAIARTLGRLGVPVYAVVEDNYTPLALSRHVTKAFVWETWPGDRDAFLDAMARIGEKIGRQTVLFPIDDLSAVFAAENADALGRWFLLPRGPQEAPRQLANKASLYAFCEKIGIPCARSLVPRSKADVVEFAERVSFPVVVKANDQWRLLSDRLIATVIPDARALIDFYDRTPTDARSRMLLQEFIPGEDWIYHGYSNSQTNFIFGCTGRKLLSFPPATGSTALGVSLPNEQLRDQCAKLLAASAYSGIIDMDWRRDERDGQYKIFDCNPRVGMNFRMFENASGIDVIRAQHLDLTGRSVDRTPMIANRRFVVESYFLLSILRGGRPAKQVLETDRHSLPPESRERAWWSGDDPLPSLVMSVRLLVRTTGRTLAWMGRRMRLAAIRYCSLGRSPNAGDEPWSKKTLPSG